MVAENPSKKPKRQYESLPPLVVIVAVLITCYLTANVMSVKLIQVCGITWFDAGTIIFPVTYLLGDVLTEVWGLRTASRVIWLTFICEIVFTIFAWIGVFLPYPPTTATTADAYSVVFAFVPRITIASLLAFLCGELTNAWFMVKIKEWTHGRRLWVRTIGSSLFGYIFDTVLFVLVAFYGVVGWTELVSMIVVQVAVKLGIEALFATPMAYALIIKLSRRFGNSVSDTTETRGYM